MMIDTQRVRGVVGAGRRLLYALGCAALFACPAGALQQQTNAPAAAGKPSTLPEKNISQKPEAQAGTPQPSAEHVSEDSSAAAKVERQTQLAVQHPGVLIDRVIAVVNGEVILESDLDEERRLIAFQPVVDPNGQFDRSKAIERLINRRLLLQQSALQPHKSATDADIASQITALRHDIPACKQFQCETEQGWKKFMEAQGVTPEELTDYLRDRTEALNFVELRFRAGTRISDADIKSYYEHTMLPEYARQHVKAPALAVLADRIQAVLLEQRVSGLLADWLQSLRAQGTVQIVADGANPS